MLKKILRFMGRATASVVALVLVLFIVFWIRFRVPTGPVIAHTAKLHIQVMDLGEDDPVRHWFIEPVLGNTRIVLSDGPLPFVYAPRRKIDGQYPRLVSDIEAADYGLEVSYRTRQLLFAKGNTPAEIEVRRVPGRLQISK